MPLSRRWLLVGALGVAVAAYWAGWLPLVPAATPGYPPPDRDEPGEPPRRRRRVTPDTGRGRTLILFGLPAAGRTAVTIRTLLTRPEAVTVPRPVTDRPDSGSDPARLLFQHVLPEQLTADRAAGTLLEVHSRGGYRYATPVHWDRVVPGEPPLRVVKAPLSELARLRRLCAAADNHDQMADDYDTGEEADNGEEEIVPRIAGIPEVTATVGQEMIDDYCMCSPHLSTCDSSPNTTAINTSESAEIGPIVPTVGTTTGTFPSSSTRPLLVFIDVTNHSELVSRLSHRDRLPRRAAESRIRAAEAELAAALNGDSVHGCFDAVITNDLLDRAAERLVAFVDEQLGEAVAGSPTGGEESRMHSARQMCVSESVAMAGENCEDDDSWLLC